MERMTIETLTNRVANAIAEGNAGTGTWANTLVETRHVLTALGLDDLDAAVERGRRAIWATFPGNDDEWCRTYARLALEAALTATPSSVSEVGPLTAEEIRDVAKGKNADHG